MPCICESLITVEEKNISGFATGNWLEALKGTAHSFLNVAITVYDEHRPRNMIIRTRIYLYFVHVVSGSPIRKYTQ